MNSNCYKSELPESLSVWKAIGLSWLAMRTTVKIWLFFLNAVFLGALMFWPSPLSQWILIAYLSSAPFLVMFMVLQRGLTRLLGVVHLIPWFPLVVYLWIRLTNNMLGPRITVTNSPYKFSYSVLLLVTSAFCLILDIWDVIRWFGGEQYVLGSREAAERKGSYDARRWLESYRRVEPYQ